MKVTQGVKRRLGLHEIAARIDQPAYGDDVAMSGLQVPARSHEEDLSLRIADGARIELDPMEDPLTGLRIDQHGRAVGFDRPPVLGAHIDQGGCTGLAAAVRLEQDRRIRGRQVDALGEAHQDLRCGTEAVVDVGDGWVERVTDHDRKAGGGEIVAQPGDGLAADLLLEARRRPGEQTFGVVQDLALVGTLEVDELEENARLARKLEPEQVEDRVGPEHMGPLAQTRYVRRHVPGAKDDVFGSYGDTVHFQHEAIEIDEAAHRELDTDRVEQCQFVVMR